MDIKVESIVCDTGLYIDNELILVLNSRANALEIKEILELDNNNSDGMASPIVYQDKSKFKLNTLKSKLKEDIEKMRKEVIDYEEKRRNLPESSFYRDSFQKEIHKRNYAIDYINKLLNILGDE